mgnify:CR=1 FL=1
MKKFLKSVQSAFKGILVALKEERNMKIHACFVILVSLAGLLLKISLVEWLWCFALVISMELMNTAIENFVDFVEPKYNEKVGKVKDIAAGAVLINALFSIIIGLIIFLPKIILLFF